MFFGTSNTNNF